MLKKWQIKELKSIPGWDEFCEKGISPRSPEEWVVIAEQLAEEHGGELPYPNWLIKNGYSGLYQICAKYPGLFQHIKRSIKNRSPEEWVPIAKQLAKKHKDVLPSYTWLNNNGYSGLNYAMRKKPKLFVDIEQDYERGKSPEEWVIIAEQLAKKNKGFLPNSKWLVENGFQSLKWHMKKYPNLFVNLPPQDKKRKVPEEWVPIAEQIAKDNDGILPKSNWLQQNNYYGLSQKLLSHPELFYHINQDKKKGRSLEEWVLIAEQLAKDNSNILPCSVWLRKNKYDGLRQTMAKHPDFFTHIEQDKKLKTPEEWAIIAEQLAKDNDGVLPTTIWLSDNGYSGLVRALSIHSKLFKHIERPKKLKTPEEWAIIAEQLAKDNDGVLPTTTWLSDNGYSGLVRALSKHSELFKHIKRPNRKISEQVF